MQKRGCSSPRAVYTAILNDGVNILIVLPVITDKSSTLYLYICCQNQTAPNAGHDIIRVIRAPKQMFNGNICKPYYFWRRVSLQLAVVCGAGGSRTRVQTNFHYTINELLFVANAGIEPNRWVMSPTCYHYNTSLFINYKLSTTYYKL